VLGAHCRRARADQLAATATLTGKPSPDGNSVRGSIRWSSRATASFGATWGPALNNLPADDAQAQAWMQRQRAASPRRPSDGGAARCGGVAGAELDEAAARINE
jgi:hypothetical protein